MKAEELMIGDWVRITNIESNLAMYRDVRVRVCEIYKFDDYEKINVRIGGNTYKVEVSEEIEPIPLTKDILEKNGWVLNMSNDRFQQDIPHKYVANSASGMTETSYDYVELEYEQSCASWIMTVSRYFKCWVDNVHELQHALRLYGIDKNIEL